MCMQPWLFSMGRLQEGHGFEFAMIQFMFSDSALFWVFQRRTISHLRLDRLVRPSRSGVASGYEAEHPLEQSRRASMAGSPSRTDGGGWGRSPSPARPGLGLQHRGQGPSLL